jgi:hypothetical protein
VDGVLLEPDEAVTRAGLVLRVNGVRLLSFDDGSPCIGLWSDLDGPHIRAALARLGSGKLPVRYLDGPGIPMRYKLRRPKGLPVPLDVVAAMDAANLGGEKAWEVRDRMLLAIRWPYKVRVYGA